MTVEIDGEQIPVVVFRESPTKESKDAYRKLPEGWQIGREIALHNLAVRFGSLDSFLTTSLALTRCYLATEPVGPQVEPEGPAHREAGGRAGRRPVVVPVMGSQLEKGLLVCSFPKPPPPHMYDER